MVALSYLDGFLKMFQKECLSNVRKNVCLINIFTHLLTGELNKYNFLAR